MTNEEKWAAVCACDVGCDGRFFYAVETTGIYCRPSCRSRPPRRENIRYFDGAAEAEADGFRPCKRCRPDLAVFQPAQELAAQAKGLLDARYNDSQALDEGLRGLFVSQHRLAEVFREAYGVTLAQYRNALRLAHARRLLADTDGAVLDIAAAAGFGSASSFYRLFRAATGGTPQAYRRAHSAPQ